LIESAALGLALECDAEVGHGLMDCWISGLMDWWSGGVET
jgi:hypothetical protein